MSRYPAQPLEEKLAWMRERMKAKVETIPERPLSPVQHRRRQKISSPQAHLRMYRVGEVAEMWGVSPQTIARWFRDRARVVDRSSPRAKRQRRVLLISEAELEAFIREHQA